VFAEAVVFAATVELVVEAPVASAVEFEEVATTDELLVYFMATGTTLPVISVP
jgi:hypothetical protein